MIDPLQSPWIEMTPYLILLAMAFFGAITLWSVVRGLHEWIFPRPVRHEPEALQRRIEFGNGTAPPSRVLAGSCSDEGGDSGDD